MSFQKIVPYLVIGLLVLVVWRFYIHGNPHLVDQVVVKNPENLG